MKLRQKTRDRVVLARQMSLDGKQLKEIAWELGVSVSYAHVLAMRGGRSWSVKGEYERRD